MPDPKYTGTPTGSGNPPGQHSDGYLKSSGGEGGHFVEDSSYRGSMNIGINSAATNVGNQPKQDTDSSLESFANKKSSI